MQQRLEGRQHHLEQRGLVLRSAVAGAPHQGRRQHEALHAAAKTLLRRPGPVGGQVQQGGRAGQGLAPERAQRFQALAGQRLALPGGGVGISQRQ